MRKNASMPSTLEIHLHGPFRVFADGQAIEERAFTRRKPKQLIKLLALQPHHQLHREQAMELLWPDSDPELAANNLHKAIHMARHALEPELRSVADSRFIHTQGQQVILCALGKLWIDAEEFERRAAEAIKGEDAAGYEAALALYEGDLLTEDPYEDWAAARREQLRMMRQDLLTKLSHLYETRGEFEQSIERLKELVAIDPSDEEVHRRLMRLYALTGSKGQALRQYRQCGEALRRELDAEPERATLELYERIVSGQVDPLPSLKEHGPQHGAIVDSLAILPLVNASGDSNVEYLSDGITESIINNLSQLPQLRVMAHSTVSRYKGQKTNPQEVGRDLHVRAVLTGRVLELGDRLIVRTELVDASDGSQLWGEQYNRHLTDIFEVQEEISREISEKLRLKLTGVEQKRLTKRYTENIEAYQLYLKGRYHLNKRTAEGIKKAIEYFEQAIEIDIHYALAFAGLADCYTLLGSAGYSASAPQEAMPKAKVAAIKALEIDDTLAEAHISLAFVKFRFDWDWEGAERGFERAIELNPGSATAHHWYALYLTAMGRLREAITKIKQAQELDPLSLIINSAAGRIFHFARQYDRAVGAYQKTLEMDSNYGEAHLNLGLTYEQKGMYEEAIAELNKAITLSGDRPIILAVLGHTYAMAGRRGEARDALDELKELSKRCYVSSLDIAIVYMGLSEKDRAFEWLQKAYEDRSGLLVFLKVEPLYDSLRPDPRFIDLARRIGLAS